jgi:hypothetical protein
MRELFMEYECLKKAHLSAGLLSGHGYALAPFEELAGGGLEFGFPIRGMDEIAFVIGFRGVGHHYRCDIIPKRNLVLLHLIKDGIPVYLQHASINLGKETAFRIRWTADALLLFGGDICFINILGEGIDSGRWGFAVNGGQVRLPDVAQTRKPRFQPRWVVLGDGYSNNRWPNRHFFSWPELTFGQRGDYLNACVAAGNTRRVLEVIEQISPIFAGCEVILAAGADDFIEGTSSDESIRRIRQILARLNALGTHRIHVCAIPPRARRDDEVTARNALLAPLALSEADGFIDFHGILSAGKAQLLVNGDYPGAQAQIMLAQGVLSNLGLSGELVQLESANRNPRLRGFAARAARRLLTRLEAGLDRLPSAGVS